MGLGQIFQGVPFHASQPDIQEQDSVFSPSLWLEGKWQKVILLKENASKQMPRCCWCQLNTALGLQGMVGRWWWECLNNFQMLLEEFLTSLIG